MRKCDLNTEITALFDTRVNSGVMFNLQISNTITPAALTEGLQIELNGGFMLKISVRVPAFKPTNF